MSPRRQATATRSRTHDPAISFVRMRLAGVEALLGTAQFARRRRGAGRRMLTCPILSKLFGLSRGGGADALTGASVFGHALWSQLTPNRLPSFAARFR